MLALLYHAEHLLDRIDPIGVAGFDPLFAGEAPYIEQLQGAALLVNAALPSFNLSIIELGIRLGANTLDLASDMYDAETERTLTFAQYRYDAALRERGVAALINFGISPGITNFLIGEHIHHLRATGRKDLAIMSQAAARSAAGSDSSSPAMRAGWSSRNSRAMRLSLPCSSASRTSLSWVSGSS